MNLAIGTFSDANGRARLSRGLHRMERVEREGLARAERAKAEQKERILELLGLEERRSFWGMVVPGAGLLGAGVLLGAACIFLLGPRALHARAEQQHHAAVH